MESGIGKEAGSTRARSAPAPRWQVAIFVLLSTIYLLAPVTYLGDSGYTLATTESLLTTGDIDLAWLGFEQESTSPLPRQLVWAGEKVVNRYPIGGALLAIPAVALWNLAGGPRIAGANGYDPEVERVLGAILAALIAAGTGTVIFRLSSRNLPLRHAALIGVCAGIGTSQLSSISRSFGSQGPLVLLLALSLQERLRWEDGERKRPALLGALLGLAFWFRPSAALPALAFAAEVTVRHRSAAARLAAAGLLLFAAFLAFHLALYGTMLPPYYRGEFLSGQEPMGALAGLLGSPSRGLFVFSPACGLGVFWSARFGFAPGRRSLGWLCLAVTGAHLALISLNCQWWGGWSYGPRLQAEVVPFLAALCAWGWRRRIEVCGAKLQVGRPIPALLVAWSIVANVPGAFVANTREWNRAPINVDYKPSRVWDWRDPQFLSWSERRRLPRRLWPPVSESPCWSGSQATADLRVPTLAGRGRYQCSKEVPLLCGKSKARDS